MNKEVLYDECINKCIAFLDRKYYPYYFLMFISAFILLFFKSFFFILVMLIINGLLSFFLIPMKKIPHGIELVMFNTVFTSYVYGSKIGAIVGVLSIASSYIIVGRVSLYIAAYIPMYALIGYLAHFFNSYQISYVGIAFSVIYSVITSALVILIFNAKIYKAFFFITTNLFFNYFMFFTIAPKLLAIA